MSSAVTIDVTLSDAAWTLLTDGDATFDALIAANGPVVAIPAQ